MKAAASWFSRKVVAPTGATHGIDLMRGSNGGDTSETDTEEHTMTKAISMTKRVVPPAEETKPSDSPPRTSAAGKKKLSTVPEIDLDAAILADYGDGDERHIVRDEPAKPAVEVKRATQVKFDLPADFKKEAPSPSKAPAAKPVPAAPVPVAVDKPMAEPARKARVKTKAKAKAKAASQVAKKEEKKVKKPEPEPEPEKEGENKPKEQAPSIVVQKDEPKKKEEVKIPPAPVAAPAPKAEEMDTRPDKTPAAAAAVKMDTTSDKPATPQPAAPVPAKGGLQQAKRHQRAPVQAAGLISLPALVRVARRAGVLRMSSLPLDDAKDEENGMTIQQLSDKYLRNKLLRPVIEGCCILAEHQKAKTITYANVMYNLKRKGFQMYGESVGKGFGGRPAKRAKVTTEAGQVVAKKDEDEDDEEYKDEPEQQEEDEEHEKEKETAGGVKPEPVKA